ncbi:hypothetical protein ACFPYI_06165 [Halomarina salina]|uniref:Uncharacterized protein n=1 Tax=Halomarina salina TaxID=1872699 RepID=A0ABD5RKL8_9EURY|nr:hypothetical protein [Halomarina salina]
MGETPEDVYEDLDIDPEGVEQLPSTAIQVDAHVHFGMTGTFPLRLADLFFTDDGAYVAEYGYVTPMFGLGTKKHRREATGMARIYAVHGIDEVLLQANVVNWVSADHLDRVVVHDGGRFGRQKITLTLADGDSFAYRLHDEDTDQSLDAVEAWTGRNDVGFERRAGVGFSPTASLRRFFGQ